MSQSSPQPGALIVNTEARPRFLRIYATPDGETHLEERTISARSALGPLTGLRAMSYSPSSVGFHGVNAPMFVINLTGELDVEVSDGTRRRVGPGDLVLLQDTTGKGHATKLLGPVTCLFMPVADDFDVKAWAEDNEPGMTS